MKHLLFVLTLVLVVASAGATNYYVSLAGNDANSGTSAATPWRTLTKVNSFTYAANDSVLLRRGDVFFGSIVVNRNNMNFGAYGTGARPMITGLVTVSSWTAMGNGIFQSEVVNAKSTLNMVTMNGLPQQIGRFPNTNAANGGYLTYEGATTLSITDNELTSSVNWMGAEVAIRKNGWIIDRGFITSHVGNTVSYRIGRNINSGNTPLLSPAKVGHGYFFLNDPRTLDQLGEWYFDTTAKRLLMYFGTAAPAGYNVKVSVIDTLFNMNNRTAVSIADINFEGANRSAICSKDGGNLKVRNSDINNSGAKAILIFNSPDVLVENINATNSLTNAIQVINRTKNNVVVRNCNVKNNGLLAGMGSFYEDSDHKGIYVIVQSNSLIEYNTVDSIGLSGIQFGGNDVIVQNNVISHFCMRVHDAGGIYTYADGNDANPGPTYTNRIVRNNIIFEGVGAPLGTTSAAPFLSGIYLDGRTMNVQVLNNSVFHNAKNGVQCNNPSNITIRDNTFFSNLNDISFMRWPGSSISNLNIKKNISVPTEENERNIYYTNSTYNTTSPNGLADNLKTLGTIDSNYYGTITDASIMFELYDTLTGTAVPYSRQSLEGWKQLSAHDQRTKRPVPTIQPYTINSTLSANLFSNSAFTSNITGMTVFGSNVTATWDNTSRLTGTGSLRMNFLAPVANRFGLLHSPVGAISNTKQYVLRFNIVGGSANGFVRAYIRKTTSPYSNLVPTQTKSINTTASTKEFLFTGAIADAGGSIVIEVEQLSGTTYIDNVEFVEVNATVNSIQNQLRFEYNATTVAKTVVLDGKYLGVDSTVFNGTITLAPFSSKVLIKGGAIDTTPVVNAGPDRSVILPLDSTILSGTAVGGTIASFRWTKISGPLQFTLVNSASAFTRLTNLVAGVYKFELKATTNKGMIGRDTISIIVTTGILPVELLDFKASKGNGNVQTQWSVTTEVNHSHYTVQRSADGRQFQQIGRVNARNNSTGESSYQYTDAAPLAGNNYYRLAMVDAAGTTTYSKTVLVQFGKKQVMTLDNASIQGNKLQLTISSSLQQPTNLLLVDAAGRTMLRQQLQVQPGTNQLRYTIPAAFSGIYYVKLAGENESVIRTLLN